jgi:hypothetical protein
VKLGDLFAEWRCLLAELRNGSLVWEDKADSYSSLAWVIAADDVGAAGGHERVTHTSISGYE